MQNLLPALASDRAIGMGYLNLKNDTWTYIGMISTLKKNLERKVQDYQWEEESNLLLQPTL